MPDPSESPVTRLLHAIRAGDEEAAQDLIPLIYRELHELASKAMARSPGGETLQPTALVHEAYLRLVGADESTWENRRHFFFAAARAMRDVLVEAARRKAALKRGGGHGRSDLTGLSQAAEAPPEDLLALEEALERLGAEDPDLLRLVELRFYAGLSERETADTLGISTRTVRRSWRYVRSRLFRELEAPPGG